MAISATCPSCGHTQELLDSTRGHKVACPHCKSWFRVSMIRPEGSQGQRAAEAPGTTKRSEDPPERRAFFPCPRCKKRVGVLPEFVGRWIACPSCGEQFAALLDDRPASDYGAFEEEGASASGRGKRFGLVLGGIVGASLLLLLVTVLLINGRPGKQKGKQGGAPARGEAVQPIGPAEQTSRTAAREEAAESLQRSADSIAITVWILAFVVFLLAYTVAYILLLAWVARDARCRNVDGGAVWVIVIIFTHWIGLLVYLASRPHGTLVQCETCGNKRLNFSKLCPHCGHA